MMTTSTFYRLKYCRLKPRELTRRIMILQDTIQQLEEYRLKAGSDKKSIVECLICKYDELLYTLKG